MTAVRGVRLGCWAVPHGRPAVESHSRIRRFQDTAEMQFFAGRSGSIFNRALAATVIKPKAGLICQMVEVYPEHDPNLERFSDACEILTWAAGRFRLVLNPDGCSCVGPNNPSVEPNFDLSVRG